MKDLMERIECGMLVHATKIPDAGSESGGKIWADPHDYRFYRRAKSEYEICSQCPYEKCQPGCSPNRMARMKERWDKIHELLQQGATINEVMQRTGSSKDTVFRVRKLYAKKPQGGTPGEMK